MINKNPNQLNQMIAASDISYKTEKGVFVFKNISVSFGKEKSGLVGKNGAGKTTLIKLLLGELKPLEGKIYRTDNIAYLPQDYQLNLNDTIAEALGIAKKFAALEKINAGESSDELLETIGADWDIKDRTVAVLNNLGLSDVSFDRVLGALSGGERVKIKLAGLFIWNADFLIFDEPTNNLDREARQFVYDLVSRWKKGMLVISHDRTLLNLMDRILELSDKGLKIYGGSYDMYAGQKQIENAAVQREADVAAQKLKKAKKQYQDVKERQQKRSSKGKKTRDKLGLNKGVLNQMKRNAEQTSARLNASHETGIGNAAENLRKAKEKISVKNVIEVDLEKTFVPEGKSIIKLENISFGYPGRQKLFKNFNLAVSGPERLAISGPNGAGKSTLIKIMLGEIKPQEGKVYLGTERHVYLDQNIFILDRNKTLLENAKMFSGAEEDEIRRWLAKFLFPQEDVFRKIGELSGGERIRAALGCILAGETPPQLIILDEPTNNLDIDSIEQIESALRNFCGTLIVISHDKSFIRNIGIEKEINLSE